MSQTPHKLHTENERHLAVLFMIITTRKQLKGSLISIKSFSGIHKARRGATCNYMQQPYEPYTTLSASGQAYTDVLYDSPYVKFTAAKHRRSSGG